MLTDSNSYLSQFFTELILLTTKEFPSRICAWFFKTYKAYKVALERSEPLSVWFVEYKKVQSSFSTCSWSNVCTGWGLLTSSKSVREQPDINNTVSTK